MRKYFKQLASALALLFCATWMSQAAAETIDDGYYYIKGKGSVTAFRSNSHYLSWGTLVNGDPKFVFKLVKADTGTDEYYMQNLFDGSWFHGVTGYFITEMRPEAERLTIRFVDQGDGTFKIRPTRSRPDMTGDNEKYNYFQTHNSLNINLEQANVQVYYNPLGQWDGWNWVVEAVPTEDLNKAELEATLYKAYEAYNNVVQYTVSDTPLITNATATDLIGTGSQFLTRCHSGQATSYSSFANLIDGKTSTCFQSTWNSAPVKDSNGNVTDPGAKAPQWLQVDASKQISGFRLKYGLRDGFWGAAEQWYDISVYATNDAEAAADTGYVSSTKEKIAKNSKWTKVADNLMPTDQAIYKGGGEWATTEGQSADRYMFYTEENLKNKYFTYDYNLLGNSYRYIRFYVNSTLTPYKSGNMDYTIGELQMYEMENPTIADAQSSLAAALKTQIENAESKLTAGTVTSDDVSNLTAAINDLNASGSAARAALKTVIDNAKAKDITTKGYAGQRDADAVAALDAAIAAGEEGYKQTLTDDEYTALATAITNALTAAEKRTPLTDGYYIIWSNSKASAVGLNYSSSRANSDWRLSWYSFTVPGTLTLAETPTIFKITKTDDTNQYYTLQNVDNQSYIGRKPNDSGTGYKGEGEGLGFVPTPTDMALAYNESYDGWTMRNPNQGTPKDHAGDYVSVQSENWLGTWSTNIDINRVFSLQPVDATVADALNKEIVEVTVGDIGYATAVFDYDATIPANVTVYYASEQNDNGVICTPITSGIIPARTPVLIQAAAGTYDFNISTTAATAVSGNLFAGSATKATTQESGKTYYALTTSTEGNNIVLKKVASGVNIPAGHAYIVTTDATSSKDYIKLNFSDISGIKSATNADDSESRIFDIQGRRVEKPLKGIYIKDGKKIAVK